MILVLISTPPCKGKKNKIKFADKNTSDTSYGFIKFRVTTLIWNIKLIIIMLKQFLYTFMVFGIETQLYHSLILINIDWLNYLNEVFPPSAM